MKKTIFILLFSLLTISLLSQDTIVEKFKPQKNYIPVYLSAVVPGAGQIYNGKWWKLPIIYAALGVTSYYYSLTDYQYHVLLQDLVTLQNGYNYTISGINDLTTLKSQKDQYRSYRDFSAMGFSLAWLLNVVDAYVDAEFKDFDVSPDLSVNFSVRPIYDFYSRTYVSGFYLRMRF